MYFPSKIVDSPSSWFLGRWTPKLDLLARAESNFGFSSGQCNWSETDSDWAAVAAGGSHSLALKADGSVWAWGWNVYGQLGDGTNIDRHYPVRVGLDNDWVAISVGDMHSLALRTDGSLWAWGENRMGQLGDGTTTIRTVPFQLGTDSDWVAISAGGEHSVAIRSDGSLWAWGDNWVGQLGDGTTINRTVPTQVGTDSDWAAASAGFSSAAHYTVAFKTDNSLWAWGWNANFQLGDGTNIDRHYPVRVGVPGDRPAEAPPAWHHAPPLPPRQEAPDPAQPARSPHTTLLILFVLAIVVFIPLYHRKRRDTPAASTENSEHEQTLNNIEGYISTLRELDKTGQGKMEKPVREIISTTEQIAAQLRKHPNNISKMRKFCDYTLPTTVKLLQNYDEFNRQSVQSKGVAKAMENIEGMSDTIVIAFRMQLDALFQDKVMDVEMELDVMRDMLRQADDITDTVPGDDSQ